VQHVLTRHRDRAETRLLLYLLGGGTIALMGLLATHLDLARKALLYPVSGVLFAYPEGLWLSLFSNRGLFYSFPLGMLLIGATVRAMTADRDNRNLHIAALLILVSVLLTSGASDCWDGGPTLAGRYLLVCMPLMVPGAAHLFTWTSRWGKWWVVFLGVYSAAFFAIAMAQLPRLPRDFLHLPRYTFKYCLPLLRDLFAPYHISNIMVGHPYKGIEAVTRQLFPLVFFIVTSLSVMVYPLRKRLVLALLAVFSVFCYQQHQTHNLAREVWEPPWIEQAWAFNFTPASFALKPESGTVFPLSEVSNRFASFFPIAVTTADLGELRQDNLYSRPHIKQNGWEQRGYRWLSVVPPFSAGKSGPRLFRIRGVFSGKGTPFVAVRHGADLLTYDPLVTHEDGRFDRTMILDYSSGGDNVQILARIDGADGRLRVNALHWTPITRAEMLKYRQENATTSQEESK